MTIAVLSDKATPIIQAIKKSKDSLDLVGGANLVEFLTETRERNEFFERILIIDTAVTKGQELNDFLFLKEYVESYSPSMEIVLGIPRDRGSQLADLFLSEFSAPMYTVAYLPKQTSIQILKDLVTIPVLELKAKYYSLDADSIKSNEKKSKQESTKKGGFFSKLFGKGNKVEETKEPEPTPQKDVSFQAVPTPPEIVNISLPQTETPVVTATPVTPVVSEAKKELENNINALFGGSTIGDVSEEEDDTNLNFGNYGEMHLQTGFIDEDDDIEEDIDLPLNAESSSEWESSKVTPVNDFSPVPENTVTSDFTPISPVSETSDFEDVKSEPTLSEISSGNSNEILDKIISLGVTLVVGSSSSKFLADYLSKSSGSTVIDTKSSVGMATYIDERSYLENTDDEYIEGGNTYYLGVPSENINSLISRHTGEKVLVNVSVSDLDVIVDSLKSEFSILTVFDEDLSAFENQLLEFEDIKPRTAREVQKGTAFALGDLSNRKQEVLELGVFSRINWKGLFK
jgi:hypothetical protein